MKKIYILLLICIGFIVNANTKPVAGFIENKGQIHDQYFKPNTAVKYLLSIPGMNIQLKQNSFSYDTYVTELKNTEANRETALPNLKRPKADFTYHFHRVDVEFIGASAQPEIIAEQPSETYYNYYTTGTSEEGATNVRSFEKATYKNIYPNIDLEFIAKEGKMKYNFILHYGADINLIKWKYNGANTTEIKNNNISINVKHGKFNEIIPESYITSNSKRVKQVKINFIQIESDVYGFSTNQKLNISSNQDLVIDPILNQLWCTYYGGNNDDWFWGGDVDKNGNTYYTGGARSASNIATVGSYQSVFGGGYYDAIVLKLTPGGIPVWCTYLGKATDDEGYTVTLDKSNNLIVSGFSNSTASITTLGSHQPTLGGGYDAFLAKFSNSGTLTWCTYYGGSGNDFSYSAALDTLNNIYLSGVTTSTNSISTISSYQPNYGGGIEDGFLVKFNSSGVRQWATYYGGTDDDGPQSVSVDKTGNVYLTGYTKSNNAISTTGSHQSGYGGGQDAFLAKFNSNGIRKWGTYYGGFALDIAYKTAIDSLGFVYITGSTLSQDSIATLGTHQTTYSGFGSSDAFLVKFDSTGIRKWGTYFGGVKGEDGTCISFKGNNVYMGGTTMSPSIIATPNTFQTNISNIVYAECYLTKFDSVGVQKWGTYLGGFSNDIPQNVMLDPLGNIYLSGWSDSNNFPVTTGAYQTTFAGTGADGFICKFRENSISTGLVETVVSNKIIIYPNPNSGSFTLQTKEDVVLEIVNELGQIVKTIKLDSSNNHQITISGLADGVYCLKDKLSGAVIKNKIVVVR